MRRLSAARSIYLPPWRVDVAERPGVKRVVPFVALARAVCRVLSAAGAPSQAAVGIILADDREMAELNERSMGHHGPTDVLSFPLLEPTDFPAHPGQDAASRAAGGVGGSFATPPGKRLHLGEIVISVERAFAQAEEGRGGQTGDIRWSPADELLLLATHGTLHLCGWDHAAPEEEAEMRALEGQLLATRRSGLPPGR